MNLTKIKEKYFAFFNDFMINIFGRTKEQKIGEVKLKKKMGKERLNPRIF